MQIKTPEKVVRGILVLLGLLTMLYFSFLLQVLFNDTRFDNKSFEKIDCKVLTDSKSLFQTKAYYAWSDFFVKDQWRDGLK